MVAQLLVFGRQGQVARALEAAALDGVTLEFAGHERLDLASVAPDIAGLIAEVRPAAVINAAAYTSVDGAETETEANLRLNRDAPVAMAEICAAVDIPFVHISTDYVFDGEKGAPYLEDDARRPINAYGRAKAEGEAGLEALAAGGARLAVMRSSWIFGATGAGFLPTMLRLGRERPEISVVADQWGCPTPASSCAEAALALTARLLDRDATAEGLFHAAGEEGMSRADFAELILRLSGQGAVRVRRVWTRDYPPTPAVRPRDTRLASPRLPSICGWRPAPLAEALAQCLRRMELA